MFRDLSVFYQVLTGTLYTWALTALGASTVVIIHGHQHKLLDMSLGFAAGVMTAASFWSLLEPAIESVRENHTFGLSSRLAFLPACVGFFVGALFVCIADHLIVKYGVPPSHSAILDLHKRRSETTTTVSTPEEQPCSGDFEMCSDANECKRRSQKALDKPEVNNEVCAETTNLLSNSRCWKRIILLIIAITVHNIPEGMAVGVGFAAIGTSAKSTFERARNLAVGIGIQNFPEGLAVSLPLHAAGFSIARSFWYGQLSGMVEPIFGVLGAVAVTYTQPILPFALAFAAGAMIYVVIDDILPEAYSRKNTTLSSWSAILGFILMMCLDVGFGDEA